jgi:hypothetical protein
MHPVSRSPQQRSEETLQSLGAVREAESVARVLQGAFDEGGAIMRVLKQSRREIEQLFMASPPAAEIGKDEAFRCSMAAEAGDSREKTVSSHLTGNGARVELQDKAVLCDGPKVFRIWQALLHDSHHSLTVSNAVEQSPSFPSVEVEDRDGFAHAFGEATNEKQRCKMVSRWNK